MCEDRGIDWLSEEEYNSLKEETMPKKTKEKRKKKQFGGGFNQPLAGARAPMRPGVGAPMSPGVGAPVRPLGFKHGTSAKKK